MRKEVWLIFLAALSGHCGREEVQLLPADASVSNPDGGLAADTAVFTSADAEGDSDATAFASVDVVAPDATNGGSIEDAARAIDAGPLEDAVRTTDAGVGGCPGVCNGGCGVNGTTCTIVISSVRSAAVDCPPGLACLVHCAGTQVCPGAINCAAGQPCRVVCDGDEACTSNAINKGGATSLCVECLAHLNPGCNCSYCTGTCSVHCVGGCGSSCGNCTSVPFCP